MSFSGNGAGRFQIRRLRNGSTAESLISANGPFNQDFNADTDRHNPNWDDTIGNGSSVGAWGAGIAYTVGTQVRDGSGDDEGVYEAITAHTSSAANRPATFQTTADWRFVAVEGDALRLTPQLLVNGVLISLDGTRSASPVNAAIIGVTWEVMDGNGAFQTITGRASATPEGSETTPNESGFLRSNTSVVRDAPLPVEVTTGNILYIKKNLNNIFNFYANGNNTLATGALFLRASITYNITGVLDAANNLQTLTSDAFITITRTVLTESSMFSRIQLRNLGSAQPGSASEVWNSQNTGNKTLRADLFIGANNVANDATVVLTYVWSNNAGTINQASPPAGISFANSGRDLTTSRAGVNTADGFTCIVTLVESSISYTSNTIELRDFLDPIQFIEAGTATADTGSNGRLSVVPYLNGAPMAGLTAANTIFDYELNVQTSPDDTTGTRTAWNTANSIANRFPGQTGGSYVADANPVLANGIARQPYDATIAGTTIVIFDGEVATHGAFIEYTVTFTSVAN